eukprot:CAMPEP_0116070328 /NCGR_PEP_ID=MMETSP0322-20121206/12952_1 /TAXON_ID=163516 /ORGANISM="Leptocylindrus danicus var. apora, Strain B651" /LENGTH=714 /DNA_ID=CAMNT_0003558131 /DNA_START=71 /DNA_END=2215 /DNA_ORIENTATION=-
MAVIVRSSLLGTTLALLCLNPSLGEYRTYNDVAVPSSTEFFSYTSGFISAPGSVNLSDLQFQSFTSYARQHPEIYDDFGHFGGRNVRTRQLMVTSRRNEEDEGDVPVLLGLGGPGPVIFDNVPSNQEVPSVSPTAMDAPKIVANNDEETSTFVDMSGMFDFENSAGNGVDKTEEVEEIEEILETVDDDYEAQEEIEEVLEYDQGLLDDDKLQGFPTSTPSITPTVAGTTPTVAGMGFHDHENSESPQGSEENDDNNGTGLPARSNSVELAFFAEPDECAQSRKGCDWTDLGVGVTGSDGLPRWCCDEVSLALGLCAEAEYGKLIIKRSLFKGSYVAVHVPTNGVGVVGSQGVLFAQESGSHILAIANCGAGEDVFVDGKAIWKSKHGYLPGDRWGEFEFLSALTFLFALLLCWYGYQMHVHSDHSIPIQRWLLITLLAGFIEVLFKAGDYWIWNEDGVRFTVAMYIGICFGVTKRAISRVLILMVCLGWGVVRDTLGGKMRKIYTFLFSYCVCAFLRDSFTAEALTDPDLTVSEEKEVVDVVKIFTFLTAFLDILVYLWIFDSLNNTIDHLETMSQHQKLKIMLRLRLILIISVLFAVFWSIFGIVNIFMESRILSLEDEWAVHGAWEINYLFVLLGVAILWRPNERAKDFAYAMEIPASGDLDDIEFDTDAGLPESDDWDDDNANNFSLDDENMGFDMGEYGNGLRVETAERA